MTQFDGAVSRNAGLTSGREVLAYALAQTIKIALADAVSFGGLLSPLYQWLAHTMAGHGQLGIALIVVTTAINALWTILGFAIFLVLRGLCGGTPAIFGGSGHEEAVTTRGAEIGAFALAYAIMVALLTTVNAVFLSQVYVSLYRSGEKLAAFGLGLTMSILSAAIVYAIFIAFRRAFLQTGR